MKYVALLRGINVGGKNVIKMSELKSAVEKSGFSAVSTHIQSGNVIFESDLVRKEQIVRSLEESMKASFQYVDCIIVKSRDELQQIVSEAPPEWPKSEDLRCYIAFIRESIAASAVLREVELNDKVDFVQSGQGVLYLSTLLSGLTRSRFTRLITKKVYRDITIRNYATTRKILGLM